MIPKKGYFRLARLLSLHSDCNPKMGAVIIKNGIIGVGFNMKKKRPGFIHLDSNSLHAEMKALINAGFNVKGCSIYVYRELFDGSPALARPCPACMRKLRNHGIKKVYYTTYRPPFWRLERL